MRFITMNKEGKRFFGWFYALTLALIFSIQVGCVEVGGGGSTSASVDADTTSTSDQPAAE